MDEFLNSDDGDILHNEKILRLKSIITELIDSSDEVRELLSQLSTNMASALLYVEVSIGYMNASDREAYNKILKSLAEAKEENNRGFTKWDREFLRSVNIDIDVKEER